MTVFYYSWPILLTLLLGIFMVFGVAYFLSRQPSKPVKLLQCSLTALVTLFCIETFSVTSSLIPPQDYAQSSADGVDAVTINDWVSAAGVSMGDLYMAWILVLCGIAATWYVKQSNKSAQPNQQSEFYGHFGITAAAAVLVTSLFYMLVVIPAYFDSNILIMDKLLFRGIIPYITVGLFFWVLLNVALLAREIVFQRDQDQRIKAGFDQNQLFEAINEADQSSSLKYRLEEVAKVTGDQVLPLNEYTQLVEQQSQMEREEVDVSILYLHTAMWAIPVLGFLGTVWGIAEAVANLIPLLKGLSAEELGGNQLANSLSGLGVAFDTTLVALSLSLPAMALISLLEKAAYEDMLVRNRIILQHVRAI